VYQQQMKKEWFDFITTVNCIIERGETNE